MGAPYREHDPVPALASFVECFWTSASAPGSSHLVAPDGCADLVFEETGAGVRGEVVGTMTRALLVADAVPTRYLGVRFRPGGLAALVAAPLAGFADDAVPIEDLVDDGEALTAAFAQGRPRDAVARVQRALAARLTPARPDPMIAAAVEAIRGSDGRLTIAALCEELGVTRQHLARRFARDVGTSPKVFARVTRLRAVLDEVWAGRRDWCALAHDAGYCDQSHLVGEWKAVMGVTPTAYLAARSA